MFLCCLLTLPSLYLDPVLPPYFNYIFHTELPDTTVIIAETLYIYTRDGRVTRNLRESCVSRVNVSEILFTQVNGA